MAEKRKSERTPASLELEWKKRHPNPSGLPEGDTDRRPKDLKKEHQIEGEAYLPKGKARTVNYSAAVWKPSPNYSVNRAGHNPTWSKADPNTWIVLHTMVGSETSAWDRFRQSAQQASSHYGVTLTGRVFQYVDEKDAAWTNGTMSGYGSNLDSITIEHEDNGAYNGPRTPQLYEASARLVANIAKRRGIPLVHQGRGGGVLRHKECTGALTACPDSLDIARIIKRAIEINHPVVPAPPPVPIPPPPPDTRPEWQRNLKLLAALETFHLYQPVKVVDLISGAQRGTVAAGTNLLVSYETAVKGETYWLTPYGSTHGDGVKKSDVEAAIVAPTPAPTPPQPVPPAPTPNPVPGPNPGGGNLLQKFLDWLGGLFSPKPPTG